MKKISLIYYLQTKKKKKKKITSSPLNFFFILENRCAVTEDSQETYVRIIEPDLFHLGDESN
jgi:hypothetical protein